MRKNVFGLFSTRNSDSARGIGGSSPVGSRRSRTDAGHCPKYSGSANDPSL